MTREKIHTIKAVAQRTGLSTHVIRAWEKRYGAVAPSRTSTNRRLYSDSDIWRLQLLHRATLTGMSIGQIANLPAEKLLEFIEEENADQKSLMPPELSSLRRDPVRSHLTECIASVERLDSDALRQALLRSSISFGQIQVIEEIIAPLMREIGDCWHEGSLRILHEHMASEVVRTYLGNALEAYDQPESSPSVISAAPFREMHELGALSCTVAAAAEGWRVTYLGPNIPAEEIIKAAELMKAKAVMLSITSPMDDQRIRTDLKKLRRFLPHDVTTIVGGNAVRYYTDMFNAKGMIMGKDLKTLRDILWSLRSGHSGG